MLTKYLSEEEKQSGQKLIYKFQALNGMAFNFMGETPVYLMAIHFGASNIELGYISSVIFLSGFLLVVLPRILAGKNLIKVQSTAWLLRGLVILLYLTLLFLKGRAAVLLILIVYTMFCSFRIVGVVIWNPIVRMLTTSQNRGEVLAQGNIANQSASVISKLLSYIVTSFKFFSGISGLLLLQLFGVFFNTTAAIIIKKIPCRETVEYHKSRNLFVIFSDSIKNKSRRYPLLLKWLSIFLLVLNGLTIVFIRKEAGFTASFVFLYTMVVALANILTGLFGKTFADRIGSRPLLIIMNSLLSICLIIWMLLPVNETKTVPIYFYYIIGFFSNFFLLSNNVLVDRLVVNSMPEDDSFSYNAMINFITAFFSLVSGLLGGVLIDFGTKTHLILPNSYSLLYSVIFVISILMVLISLQIIDKGSLSAKETAAILFSLEDLKAYSTIGKLNSQDDPIKKITLIHSISQNSASIATEELRSIMANPLSPIKGDVIKSLFTNPRPGLLNDLITEASDDGSYHQLKAIFALGAYKEKKVEDFLITLLNSSNIAVRSNAAKSLSRIGHKNSLDLVKQQSKEASNPHDILNYLITFRNMDSNGEIFREVFNIPRTLNKGSFRESYYSLTADLLGFRPQLSSIFSNKKIKKTSGLKDFVHQTRDLNSFNENHKELLLWFEKGEWDNIWNFCYKELNNSIMDKSSLDSELINLREAIINEALNRNKYSDVEDLLYDDALAAVYFTHQLLVRVMNR